MLTITTLGRWGIEGHHGTSGAIEAGPSKGLALLVYLACAPGATARRERLVDLLWADLEPETADHALRQMVWLLRKRVGKSCLRSTAGSLSLACPFVCDRTTFLKAVESQEFESAIRQYNGDFLPGFAAPGGAEFEKWADVERRRLQGLFALACEALARHRLASGRFREAVDIARRARDAKRDAEAGWRLLLEALTAAGDRVSAAVEAEQLRHLLEDEHRLPEPASAAAIRRALELPAEGANHQARPLLLELVGREREFTAVTAAWHAACANQGRHVHITGAPGLGKTRLLHDVAVRLRAAGGTVVEIRANPGEQHLRFALAAELAATLAKLPGAAAVAPASATALVSLNPQVSANYPTAPAWAAGEEALAYSLAVTDLVVAVSDERPVAIMIDDLQWGDAASVHLLGVTVQRLAGRRVLVVSTARPNTDRRIERADTERVVLQHLEQTDVALLLETAGALPEAAWAAELPAALHRSTLGSPLLVVETLRLALSRGLLVLAGGQWTSGDPVGLYDLLASGGALQQRVADLSREKSWLLLLLATAGLPLDQTVLLVAAQRGESAVAADLEDLDRVGMVARLGAQWAVAHDEIADHAIASASAEQRIAAHAALGRSLLRSAEGRDPLKAAARHLATGHLEHELAVAASRWVLAARSAGDRRPTSAIVSELLDGATEQRVRKLTRALPWRLRVRQRIVAVTAAAALILLAAATVGLLVRPTAETPETPDLILGAWRHESSGWRLYAREVTLGDLAGGRLELASLVATDIVSPDRPSGAIRPGSERTLATTRAFRDDGGEDVVLVTAGGTERRLTNQPGDDIFGAWSPDGQYMVISTDRWSNSSASSLAIIDPERPESVTRLTNAPGSRDLVPLWSPDGARIGFVRSSLSGTEVTWSICTVTVDGTNEHCTDAPGGGGVMGWASAGEIVASVAATNGTVRMVGIDIETAEQRFIAEGAQDSHSPVAGWISCFCRRNGGEPEQALLIPVNSPERAIRLEPGDPPPDVMLASPVGKHGYLDRVRIRAPGRSIPVDNAYKLRLDGVDADGAPMEPQAVRWRSRDTLIAAVDSLGTIHPRREGAVTIVATAGGWRGDSARLRIGPTASRLVVSEDWRAGIDSAWVAFGTPAPLVVRTDSGNYLAPNGDSTYWSGVFTRQSLPVSDGLGIEYLASVPLNDYQWQILGVMMVSAQAANPESWDLVQGNLTIANARWRSCEVAYPWSGGWSGRGQLSLTAGTLRRVAVPEGSGDGRLLRVRLQLFPDGRCGVAVNGVARLIHDRPVPMGDSAMLIISAYSHRTRILVGSLDVWTGVRGGVDWN